MTPGLSVTPTPSPAAAPDKPVVSPPVNKQVQAGKRENGPRRGVVTPRLRLTKTASAVPARKGGKLTYTITVTNDGQVDYPGVGILDDLSGVLDDAAFNGDQRASSGTVVYSEPVMTWSGDVARGETVTITYSVMIDAVGDGILDGHVAGPPFASNCSPESTAPECGQRIGIAELRIKKSFAPDGPKPDGTVDYTITVTNVGTAPYPRATITDDLSGVLDDAAFNGDQRASSGTVSYAKPKVTWTGDVAVDQTVTITYSTRVDDRPAGDRQLSGELAGPEGSNCVAGFTDSACGNTRKARLPLLNILAAADRKTARPGDVVVHTVTVQNVGTAAYLGATLTDELSQVLDDAVYNGDAQATTGTVSYDEPRLSWTGDVAAGETVTITYSATVRDPGTGDHLLDNAIRAPGGGTNCPGPTPRAGRLSAPAPAADRGCAHRVVVENVTISETLSPRAPRSGEVVNYTITVANAQEAPYTDAHVTDDLSGVLDDAVYNNDARASSGSVTFTGPTGDAAALPGSAASAASTASTDDAVNPQGPAAASTDDAVNPQGPAAASTDDVVDPSRSAASSISTSAASAGPRLDWKGDLPAGSEVTITYSVTVNDPPRGDRTLRSRVLGVAPGSNCSAGSADPNCAPGPTGIVLTPARTPKSASPSSPSRNPSCLRLCKPSCDRSLDSSDNRSCDSSCGRRSDSSCEDGCDSSDDRSCDSSCGRRCDSSRSSARDARSGPRLSELPFTGLPVAPVMLGILLSGLGLAVRLRARRGKP
ncbi:conserved repeat domain-containing protein [Streptosporangium subroseum]|uniref:Conserved repeat domain-containing protein n=1 Tax=Streptosporangium subroseum TaxID=106412 RepID=A0A239IQF2_9ACTN|nr:conserved repeat domain-containing protein [Streptosporangium subroseum]